MAKVSITGNPIYQRIELGTENPRVGGSMDSAVHGLIEHIPVFNPMGDGYRPKLFQTV